MAKYEVVPMEMKEVLQEVLRLELDDLEHFVETINSGLRNEGKSFERFITKKTKTMTGNQKANFLNYYEYDAFGLFDRYPKILWQAIFLALYAVFEHEMNNLCKRLRGSNAKKVPKKKGEKLIDDPSIHGEPCLADYGIKFNRAADEWRLIVTYESIRNLVIHNKGFVRIHEPVKNKDGKVLQSDSGRVRDLVVSTKGKEIQIGEHNEIILTKAFCLTVVGTLQAHFQNTLELFTEEQLTLKPIK